MRTLKIIGGIVAVLGIVILAIVLLINLFDRFNVSVMAGSPHLPIILFILTICAVTACMGVYTSWKSDIVRAVSITALGIVSPFVLCLIAEPLAMLIGSVLMSVVDILGTASCLCIITLFLLLFVVKRRAAKIACVIVFLISASTIPIIKIEQQEIVYTHQAVWEVAMWEEPQWEWSILSGWRWRNVHRVASMRGYKRSKGYNLELERLGLLTDYDLHPNRRPTSRPPDNDEERHLCGLLHPYYAPFSDISSDDISEEKMMHLWTEVWTAYDDSLPHEKQIILHAPNSTGVQTILGRERDNHLREQLSYFWHPFLWEERIIFYYRKGSIVQGTDEAERLYEQLFDSLLGQMRPKIGKSSYRWFVFGIPVHSYEVRFLTYYVWNGKHEPVIGLFKK